ncbi:DDE-type integrase/transposase/recombinase [Defluviicoccus vanus]|uniref:IS6 family transposase n=1 Tax=Defluviicoccus vanus TaxID=111831 RepID=A0A7H1N213_9PROT|nr:DDE-type integrase/transposase/recombinase [Defluviicoccus vanus]QNT69749.1 IS6 family transposase [Defluviicoccus vanus]
MGGPGYRWYLDQVFIRIRSVRHDLWRAVDRIEVVLGILVQRRRNARAACAKRMRIIKRLFRKLLQELRFVLWAIVTDKLPRYAAARKKTLKGVQHRQSRYLNNRAENSY